MFIILLLIFAYALFLYTFRFLLCLIHILFKHCWLHLHILVIFIKTILCKERESLSFQVPMLLKYPKDYTTWQCSFLKLDKMLCVRFLLLETKYIFIVSRPDAHSRPEYRYIKVQFVKIINFMELLSGILVIGCLHDQEWLKESCITKTYARMVDRL